ncbi:MAG: hypothetical protein GTO76_11365 [Planctomycetales bacterium]|nr:hypothetical protein [Planctomycetales bacterium]NIN09226.1 hypothetical protein [Planctomycetales bacterium]NIN78326.1 hypothetical protein [Planctomycetales bacterium]NIO35505.1 hypothetical protein [Planctomycetales bacterium]NIO47275.1 hypothetical protein [Planctomycetales bacterium]
MQQVKIFECLENEINSLEHEINQWLRESGARIISITGNIAPQSVTSQPKARPAPSDVLLIVLYELTGSTPEGS